MSDKECTSTYIQYAQYATKSYCASIHAADFTLISKRVTTHPCMASYT